MVVLLQEEKRARTQKVLGVTRAGASRDRDITTRAPRFFGKLWAFIHHSRSVFTKEGLDASNLTSPRACAAALTAR